MVLITDILNVTVVRDEGTIACEVSCVVQTLNKSYLQTGNDQLRESSIESSVETSVVLNRYY